MSWTRETTEAAPVIGTLHLICNAHLDPMWLWEWEEGAAAAISTFRTAADLCEEFDGFIFNHNEALLYEWVEEYEPALFERIRRLVREGKWHIMGGWFIQPDCNMPSGESFVRQILTGRRYFQEHFGVRPRTAINFDPFGHTRGLVQILAKSGYSSYIHCRPSSDELDLPGDDYLWVGYDGSTVMAHRPPDSYGSQLGQARRKIEKYLSVNDARPTGLVLWGVGNHGGGPSREDLIELAALKGETRNKAIVHSTPEDYFVELDPRTLPRVERDLNSVFEGCYTSQIRIKQQHRLLENELYALEKMLSSTSLQCGMAYPREEMTTAFRDLLLGEFHDVLPGSSTPPVEEEGLHMLGHGLQIASRLKARAFFSLASGQHPAAPNVIPILAYNPHPYEVEGVYECEFNLADVQFDMAKEARLFICHDGRELPCQTEKEMCSIPLEWRKRIAFRATLPPSRMSRFDCRIEIGPRSSRKVDPPSEIMEFGSERMAVTVNCKTGLIDRYCVDGVEYFKPGAFQPLVIQDIEDAWGNNRSFHDVAGAFSLMSPEAGTEVSGLDRVLPSVRVIENGPVRTVVESLLGYGRSYIRLAYFIPKCGTELAVHVRAHWQEARRMLKLSVPTTLGDAEYLGQVAFGAGPLPHNGNESVAQKWVAAVNADRVVTCINDGIYGSDFRNGEVRLSLLRSPAYSSHPWPGRETAPQDRFYSRLDLGVHEYRFWLNAGEREERLSRVDREALAHNEKPYLLSFFPSGAGREPRPLAVLSDSTVLMTAFKPAEDNDGTYIIRLFEPTGHARSTVLSLPALEMELRVELAPFEVRTLRLDPNLKQWSDANIIEEYTVDSRDSDNDGIS